MNNTENIHHRFLAKYDAVRDLIKYLSFTAGKFSAYSQSAKDFCSDIEKDLGRYTLTIESSFMNYENCATTYLVEHYKVSNREDVVSIFSKYQIQICSNSVLDEIENIFREVQMCKDRMMNFRSFTVFLKHNTTFNAELQITIYDRSGSRDARDAPPGPPGPGTTTAPPAATVPDIECSYVRDDEINDCDLDAGIDAGTDAGVDSFLLELHNNDTRGHQEVIEFVTVKNAIIARLDFEETCNRIITFFNEQRIVFVMSKPHPDVCKSCGTPMTMYSEDAELRCEECGLIILLQGTVYDDSQPDNQTMQGTKNKRYDPKRHCDKRLNQIQAKEEWKIPEEVITKLDLRAQREYRYGGIIRSMKSMPCKQIRRWLKQEKMTKHNHHAPLIRKIITSMHGISVIPPQLTIEEEQTVLIDFSTAMACYETVTQTEDYKRKYEKDRNRVRQRSKPNRFYYWFVLFKILSQKMRGDPRLPRILECIHLQSSATLAKDDDIWAMMCQCEEMEGYVAEPTDRNLARLVF